LYKRKLLELIRAHLEKEMVEAKSAAIETYEAATGEESQPENEYDTRALEASYLAGAQAKRVLELEKSLYIFNHLELAEYDEHSPIGPTALVELELKGKLIRVFFVPDGGGLVLQYEGHSVQVLTPKSPLGEALLGLKVGDIAVVEKGSQTLEYEIVSVS
jgi:hypothetical protein